MGWKIELLRGDQEYGTVIAENTDNFYIEVDKWEVDLEGIPDSETSKIRGFKIERND